MSNVDIWNERAKLGPSAGTGDLIAAELERRHIAKYVKDGMRVLDVGCGNGTTALWLSQRYKAVIDGFDVSSAMVDAAVRATNLALDTIESLPKFCHGDVLTITPLPPYDLAYSARCLINLQSWEEQRAAIIRILSWLRPGGLYLAVECSQDGLDGINELRAMVDLPSIVPPFHNRYLRDLEMRQLGLALWDDGVAWLSSVESVCSTYQLLSRVVNASLARDAGVEPEYQSPINKLALRLPNIGSLGQNRCWVLRRCQ